MFGSGPEVCGELDEESKAATKTIPSPEKPAISTETPWSVATLEAVDILPLHIPFSRQVGPLLSKPNG